MHSKNIPTYLVQHSHSHAPSSRHRTELSPCGWSVTIIPMCLVWHSEFHVPHPSSSFHVHGSAQFDALHKHFSVGQKVDLTISC